MGIPPFFKGSVRERSAMSTCVHFSTFSGTIFTVGTRGRMRFAAIFLFWTYCISQGMVRVCPFANLLIGPWLEFERHFYTQTLLHTDTFTHRHSHTPRVYTQTLLHTEAFTHRRIYTQKRLHTERFYTQKRLHTDFFHTDAFTYRSFYTQMLLHADAFTHRHFLRQRRNPFLDLRTEQKADAQKRASIAAPERNVHTDIDFATEARLKIGVL